jgi:hypothetical protein
MIETYRPISDPREVAAEVKRADSFYVACVVAFCGLLAIGFGFSVLMANTWPFVGAAAAALCVLFYGLLSHKEIATGPMQANIAEREAEAAHRREVELLKAKSETRVMVLDAEARAELAQAAHRARVGASAVTAPAVVTGNRIVFEPSAPSVVNADRGFSVVDVDGVGPVRIDLLNAIAHQWPTPSRDKLRIESGLAFENEDYRRAKWVFNAWVQAIGEPNRFDLFSIVHRVRAVGLPSPTVENSAVRSAADGDYGRADGRTDADG